MSPESIEHSIAHSEEFTDLFTRARRLGHYVWFERRLFEVLGAWVGTTAESDAAVLLGEMSRRHGWHAGLFFDRLPELASVDAEGLVVPPGPATEQFVDGIAASSGATERLVGVYRVLLPMLVGDYRATMASLSLVAEGSLARWLQLVIADDQEELSRGESLLRTLLVDEEDLAHATRSQEPLERVALGTHGFTR